MQRLILTVTIVLGVRADYTCICSFNGVRPVYEKADMGAIVIGYLAMDQCAQFIYPLDAKWNTIMFKHQIGFIIMNDPSMEKHCIGEPSAHDILTTATPSNTTKIARTSIQSTRQTAMHSTATSTSTSGQYTAPPVTNFRTSAASHSTGQQSTNATLTKVVNTTTLNTPTTTTYTPTTSKAIVTVPITTTPRAFLLTTTVKKIPEGHTELCPDHVKTDANMRSSFVGQFGDYCYD